MAVQFNGVQHSVDAKCIHHGLHPERLLRIRRSVFPSTEHITVRKANFLKFWVVRNRSPQGNPDFIRDGG
jgi:hypothetical protein